MGREVCPCRRGFITSHRPPKSKGKQAWNGVAGPSEAGDSVILGAVVKAIDDLPSGQFTWESGRDDDQDAHTMIHVREIISPDPERAFADAMMDLNVRLLLIPAHEPRKSPDIEDNWIYQLLTEAPCETMIIRGPAPAEDEPLSILVATQGDPDTDIALARGAQLANQHDGQLSLLFVRPDDDKFALQVAKLQLERLDRNVRTNLKELPKTIVLQDNFISAIENHCSKNPHHLVLVGTRNLRRVQSLLRPWELASETATTAVAAIRDGVPFSNRLWNEVRLWVRSRIPQLDRERRIKLVDRLQTNSRFDFDFIALILLSTLIAALGLVQNSGAVVIGAMLVAPLMNPLVGIGFALIQGNERLIRSALRSVVLGFAVAFAIALAVGLVLQGCAAIGLLFDPVRVASELSARGHPTLLDLIVALVSGIAAAYAMGRPNLLSALPGVAIAAALVPPIATSGLALAIFDFELSLGALLLFLTNIVAIILGTAIVFWAVGVESRPQDKKMRGGSGIVWPRYLFLTFVVISFVLAATMSLRNRTIPKEIPPNEQNVSQPD